MPEPLAIQIYRRFLEGESIATLALDLGIPEERVEVRIRAAARFRESRGWSVSSRYAA